MLNNGNSFKIKISFEGKITELIIELTHLECIAVKELIKLFVNIYLPNYKLKYFSLTIYNKRCILDDTLETYRKDISTNNPFFLNYNYDEANEDKDNQDKNNIEEGLEFDEIPKINFPKLEEIDLGGNGIREIEPLKNLNINKIRKIDLSFNKVGDVTKSKEHLKI